MINYKTVDEFSPEDERTGHVGTSRPGPGSRLQGAGSGGAGDRASLSGLLNILGLAQTASARAWPVIASGSAAACFRCQIAAERSPGGDLAGSGRVQRGGSGADHGF
jgi:hypothetical protein